MTEVYAALDQLRIAIARANRVIVRYGVRPLPYPAWLRMPLPPDPYR